jgi:hypothetical protein
MKNLKENVIEIKLKLDNEMNKRKEFYENKLKIKDE